MDRFQSFPQAAQFLTPQRWGFLPRLPLHVQCHQPQPGWKEVSWHFHPQKGWNNRVILCEIFSLLVFVPKLNLKRDFFEVMGTPSLFYTLFCLMSDRKHMKYYVLSSFFFPTPHGMWKLLSPTRDRTDAPCSRSAES